ncbi:MAG: TetR/AcrR family transcriptional regulator [Halothermotrichaceae bacterium]
MPPKKQYSREEIVDTAFGLAKKEGIEGISIRKVADKLGSSIAPIYVNFDNVQELKQAVVDKVFAISKKYYDSSESGSPLDVGIASLRFAKEYSAIFRDLVMKKNDYMKNYEKADLEILGKELAKYPELKDFTEEEIKDMLFKMRVFQLGLSVMAANGLFAEEPTEEELIAMLDSAGNDVITAIRWRKKEKGC